MAAVIIIAVAASAIYVGSVSQSFTNNVQRKELLPTTNSSDSQKTSSDSSAAPRPAKSKTDAVNYVLMGSDSRDSADPGAGRSDSLMVLHLAGDRRSAYLVSFPRDMYVSIPGHGKNKINAAYSYGGPQLVIRTLEGLLGTRMDHAAIVDFEGFINLTTDLGGIEVNNLYASSSNGYNFPVGNITISGDEALAYVRERHQLPHGDLDRAQRQRAVVKAILEKGLSADVVASPTKFTGFVRGVASHLTVDEELSDSQIRSTALSLRLTGKDVKSMQAPISGFATVRGMSVDVVNERQMKELAAAFKDDSMAEYAENHPTS